MVALTPSDSLIDWDHGQLYNYLMQVGFTLLTLKLKKKKKKKNKFLYIPLTKKLEIYATFFLFLQD